MKNLVLTAAILLISSIVVAQNNEYQNSDTPKNEVHLNTFNLIAFKWLDVSYERILNEESTIGVSLLTTLNEDSFGYDSYRKFSVTPYYKHFFANAYAKGFFLEAFAMINGGENEDYWYHYDDATGEQTNGHTINDYTDVAFGIGVGGKFVSKRGFVGEIRAGIGRNLLHDDAPEIVGRGGISLGYRF